MKWFRKSYLVKKEVVVNLKTDTSFRGIIWEDDGRYLVLVNASILQKDGGGLKPVRVDGQVVVPVAEIEFVQVLNG